MRISLLLLVLVATLAVGLWRWSASTDMPSASASAPARTDPAPPPEQTPSGSPAEPLSIPIARKRPTVTAELPAIAEQVPIPPLSMPIGDALAALEAHASAGDRQARIRLYHQTRCCRDLDQVSRYVAAGRTAQFPESQQAHLAEMEVYLLALDELCGEFPRLSNARMQRYQTWAREAGDPVAILEFASGTPNFFTYADPGSFDEQIQRLQARRDGALPALQRALERGNLDAVTLLASLHATPTLHRELGGLVDQSWQTAAVYNFLYLRAGGRAFRPQYEGYVLVMRHRLKPDELERAQQQADALYQRHFAGKPVTEFAPGLVPGLIPAVDFQPTPALPGLAQCPIRPLPRRSGTPASPPSP